MVRHSMRLSPRRPSERSTSGSRRAVAPAVWLPLTVRMQCGPQSRVFRALSRWMCRASAITQRPVCDRRELLSSGLVAHGAVRIEGMLVGARLLVGPHQAQQDRFVRHCPGYATNRPALFSPFSLPRNCSKLDIRTPKPSYHRNGLKFRLRISQENST